MDRNLVLRLAIKARNETLVPEELVPSLLVFGCIPRFPTVDSIVPSQAKRMLAIQEAKKEMVCIVAQLRIRKALSSKVPEMQIKYFKLATRLGFIKSRTKDI